MSLAVSKQELDRDIYQLLVGDLRGLNAGLQLIPHDFDRAFEYHCFIASERTFAELVPTISTLVGQREFSLDVDSTNGMMAVIRVRIFDAIIAIEGLT